MKPAVSLALVTSLLLPSLAASAQPLPRSASYLSNWSRVRTVIAGTRIRAVYIGRHQDRQYFVSATDETMTVLTPEHLPRTARNAVIAVARNQPGMFTATKWMEFTDGPVRVTPDGVFVKGHRVAALEDIVTTVGRDDVAEVSQEIRVRRPRPRPPVAGFDPEAAAGAAAGATGGMLMFAACGEECPGWAYLAAFVGPIVAVAVLVARHRDTETEIVYRAP